MLPLLFYLILEMISMISLSLKLIDFWKELLITSLKTFVAPPSSPPPNVIERY